MTSTQRIMLKAEFFWFRPRGKMFKYLTVSLILWFTMPFAAFFLEYPVRWIPALIYIFVSTIFFLALCSKTFIKDDLRQEYKKMENERIFNELFKK